MMKTKLFLLLIVASVTTLAGPVEEAMTIGPIPSHPRLLFTDDVEAEVKQRIKEDPFAKKLYMEMIIQADQILKKEPVTYKKKGRRLLSVSKECLRRTMLLSMCYRLSGKEVYLKRAEQEMLAVAAFSDWNPSHYLDVAEMTTALALGYDWLYDDLSSKTRDILRTAIVEKGIEPSRQGSHFWMSGNNNWNQICHGGLALGALAIWEDEPELAFEIVERSVNGVPHSMEEYKPDGTYPEGPGYWVYGTGYNVLFIAALESALKTDFGLSQTPGFLKSAQYFAHMVGPSGYYFNYSDCKYRGAGGVPALFWFAQKAQDTSLIFNQLKLSPADLVKSAGRPLCLLWYQGQSDVPQQRAWMGRGENPVAAWRSSWTDPDAVYLAIKGGSPHMNHGHMDVGSFVLEADGVRWAHDLGGESYNRIESKGLSLWNRSQESDRWKLYRYNNQSHNTLVVNDDHQQVGGAAPLLRYSDKPDFSFATFDLTSLYQPDLAHAKRGAALLDSGAVLIQDEVSAVETNDAVVRWAMLTKAEVEIVSPKSARLTQDGQELYMEILQPQNAQWETYSTGPHSEHDAENPNTRMIGFTIRLSPNEEATLTVRMVPGSRLKKIGRAKKPPALEKWK